MNFCLISDGTVEILFNERNKMHIQQFEKIELLRLSDFVNSSSTELFQIYEVDTAFLHEPADNWEATSAYQQAKKILSEIRVTNDCAERAAAHLKQYNRKVTDSDEEFQKLLRVTYAQGLGNVSRKSMKLKYAENYSV